MICSFLLCLALLEPLQLLLGVQVVLPGEFQIPQEFWIDTTGGSGWLRLLDSITVSLAVCNDTEIVILLHMLSRLTYLHVTFSHPPKIQSVSEIKQRKMRLPQFP